MGRMCPPTYRLEDARPGANNVRSSIFLASGAKHQLQVLPSPHICLLESCSRRCSGGTLVVSNKLFGFWAESQVRQHDIAPVCEEGTSEMVINA